MDILLRFLQESSFKNESENAPHFRVTSLANLEHVMMSSSPYPTSRLRMLTIRNASIAFLAVIAVSVAASLVMPAVSHFVAEAPSWFTEMVLRLSFGFVLPFGFVVALIGALYAAGRTGITRVLVFSGIYLVLIPLMLHRSTSGPLVDFTAFAYGIIIATAVVVGWNLRRRSAVV